MGYGSSIQEVIVRTSNPALYHHFFSCFFSTSTPLGSLHSESVIYTNHVGGAERQSMKLIERGSRLGFRLQLDHCQ